MGIMNYSLPQKGGIFYVRKRKYTPVDEDIIDVDDIVDGDIIDVDGDIIDVDEIVNSEKPVKMVEDEPETMEDFIEKAMARQEKTINETMKLVNKRFDVHDKRISTLEKQQEEILNALAINVSDAKIINENEPDNRNVLDKTLGAVGGVMHGIVDTAAFVLESTVDLVTLGRAKRE